MMDSGSLKGQLVLFIEEDLFLASYVGDAIAGAGGQVLGPARTLVEADALLHRLRVRPFAAVVSTKLFAVDEGGISKKLVELGSPLLLLRKDERQTHQAFREHCVLTAPFGAYQIVDHLRALGIV